MSEREEFLRKQKEEIERLRYDLAEIRREIKARIYDKGLSPSSYLADLANKRP